MKLATFKDVSGKKVSIPLSKITGFVELKSNMNGNCFIATGADGVDGEENGWYVSDSYIDVYMQLDNMDESK